MIKGKINDRKRDQDDTRRVLAGETSIGEILLERSDGDGDQARELQRSLTQWCGETMRWLAKYKPPASDEIEAGKSIEALKHVAASLAVMAVGRDLELMGRRSLRDALTAVGQLRQWSSFQTVALEYSIRRMVAFSADGNPDFTTMLHNIEQVVLPAVRYNIRRQAGSDPLELLDSIEKELPGCPKLEAETVDERNTDTGE